MNEVLIYIFPSDSEEGYVWDVYASETEYVEGNSFDGGLCTGTFDDAIDFALDAIKTKKVYIKD